MLEPTLAPLYSVTEKGITLAGIRVTQVSSVPSKMRTSR